jgi:glycine/D-amino acid oxidase-like deaminating enzyme
MTHQASEHYFDTVVIGGGQAGLAVGYHLARQDRDFVSLRRILGCALSAGSAGSPRPSTT